MVTTLQCTGLADMKEGVGTAFSNVQPDEKTQQEECLDNVKDVLLVSELERPPMRTSKLDKE